MAKSSVQQFSTLSDYFASFPSKRTPRTATKLVQAKSTKGDRQRAQAAIVKNGKAIPTTPANLAKIEKFVNKILPKVANLAARWADESGYEDITDYQRVLAKSMPKGWAITGMTKRPFGFKFNIGTNAEYLIYSNTRVEGWKRVG